MNKFQINADSFNAMLYAQGALAYVHSPRIDTRAAIAVG